MSVDIRQGAPVWADAMSADIEADTAFLNALFGWESVDAGEEFAGYRTFRLGGRAVVGLMPVPAGMEPGRIWNAHFAVEDCDAATERAVRLGGTTISEPMDVGEMIRFSMVLDPLGASFGLVQQRRDGAAFQAFGEVGAVSWLEYHYDGVPNEAMRFYRQLLDWTVVVPPWEPADNPRPYAALSPASGGAEFGGCHPAAGPELELPHQWDVMVAVDDADATCARAVELGGAVVYEPMDVPGLRVGGVSAPSGLVTDIMSDR